MTAIIAGLSLTSCQKEPSVTPSSEGLPSTQQESIISFKGLRVRKPTGVPSELFALSNGEAVREYFDKKFHSNSNARLGTAVGKFDDGFFYGTLEEIAKKYPSELGITPYSEKTMKQVRKDFPDLLTEEDVLKNAPTIVSYYNRLISNEFEPELAKSKNANKGGRLLIDYGTANQWEQELARGDPQAGIIMFNAKLDSEHWTQADYGSQEDNWRGNAYKHAVLNCQGVRKFINSGRNQWEAYDKVKQFATAHERHPDTGDLMIDERAVMDLHNNAIGRTYMKNRVSWGIFGIRSMPDEGQIRSEFRAHCDDQTNKIRIGNRDYILSLIYNNPYTLADVNYVPYELAAALRYDL
jgi:hypothetical protein